MERLAKLGMTFSNGYAAPNCSPSRLSLLTGKTPARTKMTDIIERSSGNEYDGHPLLPPGHDDNPAGRIFAAPKTEQTIAELIKAHDAGYATAHFGKWHMNGGGPAEHGFDESDGPTSNAEGQVGGDDPKLVFSLTEKAGKFIQKNVAAKKPFYLQVSHYATHEESFALASTIAEFQAKAPGALHDDPVFAAMTHDLDTAIGRLLDKLADPNGDGDDADSLFPTTYIVMLADNGAVDTISDNFPLYMGKASTWEGGVRVPFLLAGPGIAAGSRSDVAVAETDILPTIAEWVGGTPKPAGGGLDGGSFAQLARGQASAVTGRDDKFYFHFPHYQVEKGSKPMSSIRDGNLKLVHFYETGADLLFDLSKDLSEQTDLAAKQPAAVKRLRIELRDYLASVKAPMPRLNPEFGKGVFPDVDQDGLNDDWEFRELLTTTYSAGDDPDGDGKTNEQEESKKTDPLQ
jgi:arylsulfatase A-like enzyme